MKSTLNFALIFLTACVGAQFNETAPLKTQIQEQYVKASQLFEQASRDYSEKSYVYKNLKQKDPLRDSYEIMTRGIESLGHIRSRLETEKNGFDLLTQGRKQISSKDKGWDAEQNTLQSFNADMVLFNKTLAEYSNQSATFSNIVSQHKMMMMADVTEIKERMKDVVNKGKKSLQVLDADIGAAKKLALSNGNPMSDAASQTIAAERRLYSERLSELESLFNTFKTKWGSKKQKSNTDADWDAFQKNVAQSEIKAKDLHDVGERIPLELEALKNSK